MPLILKPGMKVEIQKIIFKNQLNEVYCVDLFSFDFIKHHRLRQTLSPFKGAHFEEEPAVPFKS